MIFRHTEAQLAPVCLACSLRMEKGMLKSMRMGKPGSLFKFFFSSDTFLYPDFPSASSFSICIYLYVYNCNYPLHTRVCAHELTWLETKLKRGGSWLSHCLSATQLTMLDTVVILTARGSTSPYSKRYCLICSRCEPLINEENTKVEILVRRLKNYSHCKFNSKSCSDLCVSLF